MAKKISVSSALNKKKRVSSPNGAPSGAMPTGRGKTNEVFAAAMQAQAAGRLEEALSLLEQVRQAAPDNPNAMLGTAMTYYLKKDYPAAREWIEKAHAANIDDGSYYLNLGLINDSEGKFDAALECHRKAIALLPRQQQGHYNMGLTLAKMGRHAEAADAYAAALQIAPQDQDILRHLAEALLAAGRDEEAMPLFAKYISACPNKCEAWSALADIQRKHGDIRAASECYEKALAANPQAHNTHYRYACMLRENKQLAVSLPHFRKAYELMPNNLGYICDLSYATANSGDYDTAVKLADVAIKTEPTNHHSYMLKGLISLRHDNLAAIAAFDKAMELNSAAEREVIGLKALALHFSGMVQDAETCFKRAIELTPDNSDCYLNYGNTLMAQARIPECLENLAQSIRLRPTFHYALSNVLL